jgi:hypothetical protein
VNLDRKFIHRVGILVMTLASVYVNSHVVLSRSCETTSKYQRDSMGRGSMELSPLRSYVRCL